MKKPNISFPPRELREDFHLRIADQHVDLLNSLPDFRDLPTRELFHRLPKKFHAHVPSAFHNDRMARAVIIGMLVSETQVARFISTQFLERV